MDGNLSTEFQKKGKYFNQISLFYPGTQKLDTTRI